MRLKLFSVTKFRSITKAEKMPLGDLTVLIGPNNEGKSNILEALAIGMQELASPSTRRYQPVRSRARGRPAYERSQALTYEWERDFPRSLADSEPDGRTTMSFDFELTPEEVEEFQREVGNRFNQTLPLSLSFGPTGLPTFRVRKQGQAQKTLANKRAELASFVAARVQVQYVPAVRTSDTVADLMRRMVRRELAEIAGDPAYQRALAEVERLRQPRLDALSEAVTQRLKSLLPEVTRVNLEMEEDRVMQSRVSVILDDGTATDLSLKGDGVQSLAALAMMEHYSRQTARAREFILAVEEPEAHLHPSAIHALRETLHETAESQQVVLTTHSPLFVNRLDLSSNIIVRKNQASPARSVREVREVLGVHIADNLASAEVVLVVEGPEDKIALDGLLAFRSAVLATAIRNGVLAVMPLHGAGKMNYLLSQVRESLAAVHAFLDNDDAGRTSAAAARNAGLLSTADVTMAICPGSRKDSEFEDLVDPAVYCDAFLARFNVDVSHPWTKQLSRGKWSRRMPAVFQASGATWDEEIENEAKATLAAAVAERPDVAIKTPCGGVVDALVTALESKLKRRSRTMPSP